MFRNKLAYVIFLILSGVFAVFYNSYFTGVLFFAVLLMPFVLFIILSISAYSIKVEMMENKNIVSKDEKETIILKFTNNSVFPVNRILIPIQYINDITGVKRQRIVELAMDHNNTQKVRLDLQSSHCGNIRLSISKIVVFDYLHIWKKRKKVSLDKIITVVPNVHEVVFDLFSRDYVKDTNIDSEKYSKVKKGEDVSEVFEIRDYRRGDKPNRIHWKLSQKMDQVMIKEFSEPLKDSLAFILYPYCKENGEQRLNLMDGFLEVLVAVSHSFLQEGRTHSLMWLDTILGEYKEYTMKSHEDRYGALKSFLASPTLTDSRPVMKEFQELCPTEYSGLFFITTQLDAVNLEHFIYVSKITSCVLLYVNDLTNNKLSEEVKQDLYRYQILHYEIDIKSIETSFLNIFDTHLTIAE